MSFDRRCFERDDLIIRMINAKIKQRQIADVLNISTGTIKNVKRKGNKKNDNLIFLKQIINSFEKKKKREKRNKWKGKNKNYFKEYQKEYIKRDYVKLKIKNYHKQYYQRPEIRKRQKEHLKKYYQKPEAIKYRKEYYQRDYVKRKFKKYMNYRRKNDSVFKIKDLLITHLWIVLKLYSKTGKIMTSKKIGIDYKKIIENLKPFPKDIKNYHIDHIVPCVMWNHDDVVQVQKCWSPVNLQWLTANQNRWKRDRLVDPRFVQSIS